jgi:hypothetical protein
MTLNYGSTLRVLILLAALARTASALYQGNEVDALPGVADQISYHRLATRVLEGHGFSFDVGWWPATPAGRPTAHWSYLYVIFLAAVYFLFGPNPIMPRLIQAVLTGVLQPLLTWRIARRLLGPRAGVVAAAISAFYAYFVFYGGALMTESFYIAAILWALDIATAMTDESNRPPGAIEPLSWAKLGLACAVAVLLRQVFLLLVPVILLWVAWRLARHSDRLSKKQLLGRCAISAAILTACIAPWTIRNYRAFHTFVLLNTNSGFAFFWGNHPVHGERFIPILHATDYGALIPPELRGMNEAEMDKALLRRGLNFVRENPVRYILLSSSRVREYFKFWPEARSNRISNYARVLSFGILFPFALLGLALIVFQPFKDQQMDTRPKAPGTSLLLAVAAGYTLIHLLTWTLIRYRLPVDSMLMPFAASGICIGFSCIQGRRRHRVFKHE